MHSFAWWPNVIVLVIASFTDLRSRRIPNWLSFPFLVSGLSAAGWLYGWHGLAHSAAGAGVAVLIFGAFFCMGGMGAGDVKLCAAIGSWIGPGQLLIALVLTGLAGGFMVLCWALYSGFLRTLLLDCRNLLPGLRTPVAQERLPMNLHASPRRAIPYAPAIAAGTLLSFFAQ